MIIVGLQYRWQINKLERKLNEMKLNKTTTRELITQQRESKLNRKYRISMQKSDIIIV